MISIAEVAGTSLYECHSSVEYTMSNQLPPAQFPDYPPPTKRSTSTTPVVLIVLIVVLVAGCVCGTPCVVALLLPALQSAREAGRQQVSMNNLRQIGVAMQEYHDTHKTFPPAFIPDENGKPRTSWRTLILPFMEQRPLADQYDFNVAWDHPKNEAVRRTPLGFYRSPRSQAKLSGTTYVVVTRSDMPRRDGRPGATAFPGAWAQSMANFRDGTSNTILVIEIRNSDIEWSEPRDIDFNSLSNDPKAPNSLNLAGGILVLMGDGSVHRLDSQMSMETLRELLTADGREPIRQ